MAFEEDIEALLLEWKDRLHDEDVPADMKQQLKLCYNDLGTLLYDNSPHER